MSDGNGGPLAASTLYVALGQITVLNDQFPASGITFDVSIGADSNPQLVVSNTTGNNLVLTFSKRTWQSLSSATTTITANLRRVTGHVGLRNMSSQTADSNAPLRKITGSVTVAQAVAQTVIISGQLPPIATGIPLPSLTITSAVVTFT